MIRVFLIAVLACVSAGSASAIDRAQRLGDLVPRPQSDLAVESFAHSAAQLDAAPELLVAALATGQLVRSDGEAIPVRDDVADAVHGAIEGMGRGAFAPLVAVMVDSEPGEVAAEQFDAARKVLELVGNRLDLPEVFALTDRIGSAQDETTNTRKLEGAVEAIVTRDPRALYALSGLFGRIGADHRNACVRVVGRTAGIERRHWLAARCGTDDAVDLSILSALARPDLGATPIDTMDLERVREYLTSDNPQLRREAARATAALGDMGAVSALVDNLDDDFESVRVATRAALLGLTQLRLGDESTRWIAWLEREEEWFTEESMFELDRLAEAKARAVPTLLASLATHRLYRDEIAHHVEPLLTHDSPAVRLAACTTLRRLGSHVGVEGLIDALEDEDEDVARAADRAVRSITGITPEARPEAWLTLVAN